MAHTYKLERGSSAALPVFNLDKKPPNQDALVHDRLPIKGLQHSLPATSFKHSSTLLDTTTDYYGCGGKRSVKSSRNSSAPKPRPLAASIVNEASRRVHSMRILSTSKPLPTEGLPLDWRDDTHYSLSNPKQGVGSGTYLGAQPPPFNVKPSMDSSISFSRGFSQEFPLKKGFSQEFPSKSKPPPRQQSPSSNKTKAAFKYLNAKVVAEKLVKALTKDKTLQGETTDKMDSLQAQKGKKNLASNTKLKAPKLNESFDLQTEGHSSKLDEHSSNVNGSNGYLGSPPRASIEYSQELYTTFPQNGKLPSHETRLSILNSDMLHPTSEKVSFYEVLDPLEARARTLEEQANSFGSGNELSDVLIRTLVNDGDCEYDTLEIHIDVLRKEFRKHMEDKRDLALNMAAELRARLSERVRAEETLKKARVEMESKVRMMEREKVEMKNRLQEDMEESEAQWASKYEKIRSKEKRLSERLKEILEEKVELHKEVSSLTTKKNALVEEVQGYQQGIKSFKERSDESMQEVTKLRKALEESIARSSFRALEGPGEKVQEGYNGKLTEEESNTLARKYRHKEKEALEKPKVVGKLQKLCKEQEKTIAGLRIALGEQANNAQVGKGEFIIKLQRELVRLTGIEQGLRKEVEAYKAEAVAAKRENASLIERLGRIMKKLGSAALRMADTNDDVGHAQKPANHTSNREMANGSMMKLEEFHDDEGGAELDLSNNNGMALVLLGNPPSPTTTLTLHTLDDVAAHNPRLSQVHDLGLESQCREGDELEKLREDVQNLAQNRARLQEEASNLHNALSLTNRRVRELETQLANKEQELAGIHEELGRVRDQRDSIQKEADFMGREAIQLSAQVERLSRKVERLDEDVMVKDGQLSILRGALHDDSE